MGPKTHFLLLCFSSPGWLCSFWIFSLLFFLERNLFPSDCQFNGLPVENVPFLFFLIYLFILFFFWLNIFSLLCFGSILSHVARDFFLLRSLGLWLLIRVLNARQCLFLITEVPSTTFVKNKIKLPRYPVYAVILFLLI